MEEKIRRLLEWAKGKKAPPYTLDINPTDKCNLKCLYCWQRAYEPIVTDYELPDSTWIRIVKEALKLGVEEFEITGGGEPLMRKKLVLRLIEMIKEANKFGNITTNGTLFDELDMKKILKLGWDRITFSLDSPNKKINDYLRGKGSYEKVIQNISLINKLKRKYKSKKPLLKFNVVINRKNHEQIGEMVRFAYQYGVKMISFESMTIHSSMGKKLALKKRDIKRVEEVVREGLRISKRYGIITNLQNFFNEKLLFKPKHLEVLKEDSERLNGFSSALCFEPWWHLVVKVDGSVQPCCIFDSKEENVKEKSLKEIWFGKFFEKIRKMMMMGKFPEFCRICNSGQIAENIKIKEILSRIDV